MFERLSNADLAANWFPPVVLPRNEQGPGTRVTVDGITRPRSLSITAGTVLALNTAAACIRLIAGAIATSPLQFMQRQPPKRIDHDYWWLFNESLDGDRWSAAQWWEFAFKEVALRGDAYAALIRRGTRVVRVVPLRSVTQWRDERTGERIYQGLDSDNRVVRVMAPDCLHLGGCGFDGERSMSVLQWGGRQTLFNAMSVESHAGSFFQTGAHPQYALQAPVGTTLDDPTKASVRESWDATYVGGGINGTPLILPDGIVVKELTFSSADAQLIESRRFSVEDVCRIFGVNPPMIGHPLSGSPLAGNKLTEHSRALWQFTVRPVLLRWQQELNRKLFPIVEAVTCQFDPADWLRADPDALGKYVREMVGGSNGPGALTINEARAVCGYPPIAAGDELYRPGPPAAGDPSKPPLVSVDVQAEALNGAQVASLQSLLTAAASGQMPIETAAAAIRAAFPLLSAEQVEGMISPLRGFEPTEEKTNA